MEDHVNNCIDLITEEIERQQTTNDFTDVTGQYKSGRIQGLEIARMLLTRYYEDNC